MALAFIPYLASAQSASDVQAQIQTLLTQVAALQRRLAALPPVATTSVADIPREGATLASAPVADRSIACPVFNYTLSRGQSGEAITALQKFLSGSGFLTADSVTGFYGALTEAAVRNFQTEQDIVSSGDAATSGWGVVGKRTSAAIVRVCSATFKPTPPAVSVPASATSSCMAISLVCPAGAREEVGPDCSHTCVSGAQTP